jgi:hypothetical protein
MTEVTEMTTTEERPKTRGLVSRGRRLWQDGWAIVAGFGLLAGVVVNASNIWVHFRPATPGPAPFSAELDDPQMAANFLKFLYAHENQQVMLDVTCSPGPAAPVGCTPGVRATGESNPNSIEFLASSPGDNSKEVVNFATTENADASVEIWEYGSITVHGVFSVPRAVTADKYTTVYNLRATQAK